MPLSSVAPAGRRGLVGARASTPPRRRRAPPADDAGSGRCRSAGSIRNPGRASGRAARPRCRRRDRPRPEPTARSRRAPPGGSSDSTPWRWVNSSDPLGSTASPHGIEQPAEHLGHLEARNRRQPGVELGAVPDAGDQQPGPAARSHETLPVVPPRVVGQPVEQGAVGGRDLDLGAPDLTVLRRFGDVPEHTGSPDAADQRRPVQQAGRVGHGGRGRCGRCAGRTRRRRSPRRARRARARSGSTARTDSKVGAEPETGPVAEPGEVGAPGRTPSGRPGAPGPSSRRSRGCAAGRRGTRPGRARRRAGRPSTAGRPDRVRLASVRS